MSGDSQVDPVSSNTSNAVNYFKNAITCQDAIKLPAEAGGNIKCVNDSINSPDRVMCFNGSDNDNGGVINDGKSKRFASNVDSNDNSTWYNLIYC